MLQQLQPVPACRGWASKLHRVQPRTATSAFSRRAVIGGLYCCSGCACSHRSQWYDKYFAYNMAVGMEDYEAAIRPVKQQLFTQLFTSMPATQPDSSSSSSSSSSDSNGAVSLLEVGMGTGPNLPFYTPFISSNSSGSSNSSTSTTSSSSSSVSELSVTGLEPNTAMWGYAQQAASAAGLQQQQLTLVEGDAQQMPFDSSSFDAAVITLVLCSVPQPQAVLSELLRVLKPGGQLLLIEHVISPQLGFLQFQQRLLDPLQRLLADNCHLTRDTAAALGSTSFVAQPLPPLPLTQGTITVSSSSSGGSSSSSSAGGSFSLPGVEGVGSSSSSGVGDLWRFEVEGMGLIAPHVAGILRKPL